MKQILLVVFLIFLSSCGSVSNGDIKDALETAWSKDYREMARLGAVDLPGMEPGAMRGFAETVGVAKKAATEFGSSIAGKVADEAINKASGLASDYGIEGADEVRKSVGLATASDWTIRNFELLSGRESGEGYVALVRYDLFATVNGEQLILGRDITHRIRLIDGDNGWEIERSR